MANESAKDRDVVIVHTFNAPREVVFKAWTDIRVLGHWYAPRGCTIEFKKLDAYKGGTYLSCINNPQFGDCWCVGTYLEFDAPNKLVFTMAISDESGNRLTAEQAGMHPDWPEETIVTITLVEENGKTKLTLHQTVSLELAKQTGAYPSWLEMLGILDEML